MSSTFKPGDKVIMVGCYEANRKANKDKVWEVTSKPYPICGFEVVKLQGRIGGFATKYLKKVEV